MPAIADYPNNLCPETVTLPAAAGATDEVQQHGTSLAAIILPATLVSTALTVEGSIDGANWYALYDEVGAAISIAVAASRFVTLGETQRYLSGVPYLRFRTAATESSARTLTLVFKPW